MGNRRKGRMGELEWSKRVEGRRVSVPGMQSADVEDKYGRLWEVKRTKKLPESIKMHLRQAKREGAHAVAIREDRGQWIVIMFWDDFERIYFNSEGADEQA